MQKVTLPNGMVLRVGDAIEFRYVAHGSRCRTYNDAPIVTGEIESFVEPNDADTKFRLVGIERVFTYSRIVSTLVIKHSQARDARRNLSQAIYDCFDLNVDENEIDEVISVASQGWHARRCQREAIDILVEALEGCRSAGCDPDEIESTFNDTCQREYYEGN